MGWLSRMQGEARAAAGALGHPRDPVIASWLGAASMSAAGMSVTADSAKRVAGVYASVRVLAETLASMPLLVWKRTANGKERDPAHPLWDLLHTKPNRRQTSFEWREMMIGHTALRGDAFCRVVERGDGVVTELLPLHPDRTLPFEAPDGRVAYRYTPAAGAQQILLDHEVLRFPGWSEDGVDTLSPISLHRETIGYALALREYGARFFGNSAAPKGGIRVPASLGEPAVKALRESWERRHQGPENAGKLAIFDAGMEWVAVGLSNDDAQYIEQQKFTLEDIARIFRVPPHKIGHLERSTNNNIEHQAIEFVTDTLLPWVRRIEDRLNLVLLTAEGRKTHFIGFEMKGLLRGDAAARSALYRELFHTAAMSPNDILRAEDMDTYAGGDVRYVPLNMAPADKILDVLLKAVPPAESRASGEAPEGASR